MQLNKGKIKKTADALPSFLDFKDSSVNLNFKSDKNIIFGYLFSMILIYHNLFYYIYTMLNLYDANSKKFTMEGSNFVHLKQKKGR